MAAIFRVEVAMASQKVGFVSLGCPKVAKTIRYASAIFTITNDICSISEDEASTTLQRSKE